MERDEEKKDLPLSYDLACPLLRDDSHSNTKWHIIEKGTVKSNKIQRYVISPSSIKLAKYQIREHIWKTACNKVGQIHEQQCQSRNFQGSSFLKVNHFKVYMKEELYQFTETVKARGVVYTLLQLSDEQKCRGVVASSTGSFAYSLCHFGKKFGIPVTIVMPLSTTDENIKMCQNCADSRATVSVQGNNIFEAHSIALRIARMKGLVYIDGNDHPNMIIGQATLGIEICKQKKIDAVILPTTIQGCGLTNGIAMAIKGRNSEIKVIQVHTETFNSAIEDIRIETNSNELDIPVEKYVWHEDIRGIPNCWFDKIIMVDDAMVQLAAEFLLLQENICDRNAAIGLAAIFSGQLDELKEKRIVLPIYGKIDLIDDRLMTNESDLMEDRGDSLFE